jgi:hypothetical protein
MRYIAGCSASLYGRTDRDARPPSYRISWSDGLAIGLTLGAALWLSVAPGLVLRFG